MEHVNEFIDNNWIMVVMWFVLLTMIIYSFLKSNYDISPQQVVLLMSHEAGSLVVDVRENNEYQESHIKDSLHIPLGELNSRIAELKKYKDKNIIMGCRSGSRSARACGMLKKKGFLKVHNLQGGVIAWEKDNLPMTSK
jgi:rhodanese-related sulfurtransferase